MASAAVSVIANMPRQGRRDRTAVQTGDRRVAVPFKNNTANRGTLARRTEEVLFMALPPVADEASCRWGPDAPDVARLQEARR
ncbi:hypothetical protein GCM10023320_33120 [Pseudonocardia adelaidensis]|uniref:Uncharacterized protein n=1 Tax=Pseudonocardia adelaidensis TaxID=648754 RepID=A0ABP9NL67_9PSEU